MSHNAKASVTAPRPDNAKMEGETIVQIELPTAGVVEVEAKTLVSPKRMLASGKVTVDGRVFFEKRWQR